MQLCNIIYRRPMPKPRADLQVDLLDASVALCVVCTAQASFDCVNTSDTGGYAAESATETQHTTAAREKGCMQEQLTAYAQSTSNTCTGTVQKHRAKQVSNLVACWCKAFDQKHTTSSVKMSMCWGCRKNRGISSLSVLRACPNCTLYSCFSLLIRVLVSATIARA